MSFGYFYGAQSEAFSFFRIPRELIKGERFKKLSTDAKLLYGLMLDRMGVSAKNGWYDELGRVYIYYTIANIMEDMCCAHGKAGKLLQELDSVTGIGLIERVKQDNGKPTMIYVKQFIPSLPPLPGEKLDTEKQPRPMPENGCGDTENRPRPMPESGHGQCRKSAANYNNKNYNKPSYTYPSINPMVDGMDELREQVKEQIDYEMLCHYYPYDDPESILELICDVLSCTAESIKLGNESMPSSKLQQRFRKLTFEHVAYVLDAFKECTSKIHNIRAYLLTALYNAPLTMGHYYSAAVRYDNAEKFISP